MTSLRQRLRLLYGRIERQLRPGSSMDDVARARALIAAVDRGGLPLNPARVNQIARDLGLEVSRHAPVEQTIERIRAALRRLPTCG